MTALQEAKEALAALRVDFPFVLASSGPGEPHGLPGAVTGVLRTKSGQALVVPIPNSASTVAGLPGTLEFLTKAPELLSNLIEEVENAQKGE